MLIGATLTLAVVALALACVAILIALFAVGKMGNAMSRLDRAELAVASLEGHRVRIDANCAALVRALPSAQPLVVAAEPRRPQ